MEKISAWMAGNISCDDVASQQESTQQYNLWETLVTQREISRATEKKHLLLDRLMTGENVQQKILTLDKQVENSIKYFDAQYR